MAQASIPVHVFNPGQVFSCLGFLEAAEVLLGNAEGGFNWTEGSDAYFELRAGAEAQNPFETVLEFLAEAEIRPVAHRGSESPVEKNGKDIVGDGSDEERDSNDEANAIPPAEIAETFPASKTDRMALPVRLIVEGEKPRSLWVSHWADGSTRNRCKLYAGNRSAAMIARAMLRGTRKKPAKTASTVEAFKTLGLTQLWQKHRAEMIESPFEVLTSMGGSFNFDPRGAWTPIDVGYSPNDQKHGVEASPVVEILAAIGLEHARPDEVPTGEVCYGVWKGLVPTALARPALGGCQVGVPIRTFVFTLDSSGKKNKIVTFAREETQS